MPLFGAKRKKEAAPLSPGARLAAALGSALQGVPGLSGSYRLLEAVSPPALGSAVLASGALAFRGSNAARAAIALSSGNGAAALFALRSLLELLSPGKPEGGELCEFELGAGGADAFLWQAMELKPFGFSRSGPAAEAWLYLAEEDWERIKAPASAGKAPDASDANGQGSEGPAPSFLAARPFDLALLEAFAARSFKAGSHSLHSDYLSFSLGPPEGAEALGGLGLPEGLDWTWFKASYEILGADGRPLEHPHGVLYAIAAGQDSPTGQAQALAGALFTQSLGRFLSRVGSRPGRLGLSPLDAMPALSPSVPLCRLGFVLRASGARLPAALLCPLSSFAALAGDAPAAQALPGGDAPSFFRWNALALARSLAETLSPPGKAGRPALCLNELLDILSDRDAALAIQNYLLPERGAAGLAGLVSYNATIKGPDGAQREAVLPMGPLNPGRLESFLPEALRGDFRAKARALSGIGAEACSAANRDALLGLSRAVLSGRVAASERLRFLLRKLILEPMRAVDERRLAEMAKADIPFARLRALEPRAAQRVCAALQDRVLALAMLDRPDEMASMKKLLASSRRQRLGEDMNYMGKALRAGRIEPSELLAAKEAVIAAMDADEEKKKAELEKEARRREGSVRGSADPPEPGNAGRRERR